MTEKQSKNFKYLDGKDYDKKIGGLPQLEKIHKFADEELQKFDSFALIALNHKEDNSFEDDSGNLCNGTIITKLGSEEEYKDYNYKDRTTKSAVSSSDYRAANLGVLISHLIDAQFDSKKEKIDFYQTLFLQAYYEDGNWNQRDAHLRVEVEKGLNKIRKLITENYDIVEGITLLNSTISAIDRWQNLTDEDKEALEKSRKEFDKRKK